MTPYVVILRKLLPALPYAAIALFFILWRGAEREADRYEVAVKAERAAHAITRASVATLQAAIEADNAEDAAAGEAYQDARVRAAQAQGQADTAFATTRAAIGALRASVGQNAPNECNVPSEVRNALR